MKSESEIKDIIARVEKEKHVQQDARDRKELESRVDKLWHELERRTK